MLVKAAGEKRVPGLEVEGSHPKDASNPMTLEQCGRVGHT